MLSEFGSSHASMEEVENIETASSPRRMDGIGRFEVNQSLHQHLGLEHHKIVHVWEQECYVVTGKFLQEFSHQSSIERFTLA
jgi:hypothetical protein